MALDKIEQITQLIESKKNILITFKKHWDGDALGSALALKLFLEQMEKRVTVVCDGFVLPSKFSFLHKSLSVKSQIGDLHQFIINLDIAQSGLSELSYDIKDNKLRIFITPKEGYITKEQITTSQTEFKYDLIITVDSPDLHSLEKLYTGNEDFFYQTPIINIDHKSSNENFGHINIIDLPASTSSEIIYHTLKQLKPEFITKEIAVALLTGIITGTNSFKKKKVRPQTLVAASELVDLGADRGFIIKQVYQTKTIATFKLWGAALSHLEHDPKHKMVWTTLTREDFSRCGASTEDLPAIIDELITTSPDAELILLLHEHPTEPHIEGMLRIIPAFHATEVMKKYHAQGDEDDTTFKVSGKNLKEVENEIVAHIKSEIAK
ncbi:MAG: DHH family phosphoesterase [Candidatus Magasanikbacteria bacterium]